MNIRPILCALRDGATPWQTLLAATKNAAAVCGAADDLGTVEVGKLADLIVVAANPLEDINNVRRLLLVLKEGRIVSDKRSASARSEDRSSAGDTTKSKDERSTLRGKRDS